MPRGGGGGGGGGGGQKPIWYANFQNYSLCKWIKQICGIRHSNNPNACMTVYYTLSECQKHN